MGVPGIIVARTDAEAANLLDGRERRARPAVHPGRHQPAAPVLQGLLPGADEAVPRRGRHRAQRPPALRRVRRGVSPPPTPGSTAAGSRRWPRRRRGAAKAARRAGVDAIFDKAASRFLVDLWETEAGLETFGEAVAEVLEFRAGEGETFAMTRRRVAQLRRRRVAATPRARRPRASASTSSGTASSPRRPRATTRSAAASSTPSPSRSPRRRSPTSSGWRPRPPTSTRRASSPRRSTRSSPRRCWPTTSRRRSTGTPPA